MAPALSTPKLGRCTQDFGHHFRARVLPSPLPARILTAPPSPPPIRTLQDSGQLSNMKPWLASHSPWVAHLEQRLSAAQCGTVQYGGQGERAQQQDE